jgi:hypothetical protein
VIERLLRWWSREDRVSEETLRRINTPEEELPARGTRLRKDVTPKGAYWRSEFWRKGEDRHEGGE